MSGGRKGGLPLANHGDAALAGGSACCEGSLSPVQAEGGPRGSRPLLRRRHCVVCVSAFVCVRRIRMHAVGRRAF